MYETHCSKDVNLIPSRLHQPRNNKNSQNPKLSSREVASLVRRTGNVNINNINLTEDNYKQWRKMG